MSHFTFLQNEWPGIFADAVKAESAVMPDPRTACFYARRALEQFVAWMYLHDSALRLPYQDNLAALLDEPTFKKTVGEAVYTKAKLIQRSGNSAVHSHREVRQYDALQALRELFHISYWFARTYARAAKPATGLTFDQARLPSAAPVTQKTLAQLQELQKHLAEKDEQLSKVLSDKENIDAELKRVRAELAEVKAQNVATPDTHDYSEAQTRDYFIDLLLREAGWALTTPGRDTEYPVSGMPSQGGEGFVDYVLWGADGKPLAIVEAKRTRKSPQIGQQQARLYADCLEAQFGRRPVIFYSNGYEHWLWDDAGYPPRQVQGFYTQDELELLHQRRSTCKRLDDAEIDMKIVERSYQTRAIRRVAEAFERDNERKALLVMATGSGKTRTVIALCDLLMRCQWAKRVLFLADRTALVNQAVGAFKKHLPDSAPVNLVTERHAQGRVYVSTYPTMMGMIDEMQDGRRKFGPGYFDLVIIDEAHRSVYQKYRAIFQYFDSLLVGLTATPKDEVDRDTYDLFDLEKGVPTDAYTLDEAVNDGYLVPPRAVSVPLKFQREGIKYADLSEEDKEKWDALEWSEDDEKGPPDRVEAEAVNRWLFNIDTVDKVLELLMTKGQMVAGGDQLGKTIIFAKNQDHAKFIAERFDVNYPQYKGAFAGVIHCGVAYAQSLIDQFSDPAKLPQIAISVDMLDTGIDVPEVLNLVFFKLVRSKTKFWQMLGRGTRLSPNVFGPGLDKEFFYVFDFCQNLEFFSQNPEVTDGSVGASLSRRLFNARLELVTTLDQLQEQTAIVREGSTPEELLREETAQRLWEEVAAMNRDNFIVRPHRRVVEKYAQKEAWQSLEQDGVHSLTSHIAGLPHELPTEDPDAKQFDLLLYNLQLTRLKAEPSFERLSKQVRELAGALEELANVPMVKEQLPLIQDLQTQSWWEDVTLPMLEQVRKRLRMLIRLIDRRRHPPLYTDFEDDIGEGTEFPLPGISPADDFKRFRAKARHYLREHLDHIAIHKLYHNEPLTPIDLQELEQILMESGASEENLLKALEESQSLGIFVRSLVGLDRKAAKHALSGFTAGTTLSANQQHFLDEIVKHLTEHGVMEPARLYESPYTDYSPTGVDGMFSSDQAETLFSILSDIRLRASA